MVPLVFALKVRELSGEGGGKGRVSYLQRRGDEQQDKEIGGDAGGTRALRIAGVVGSTHRCARRIGVVEAEQRLRTVKKVMVVQQHHVLQISSGKCDVRDLGRNKGAKNDKHYAEHGF